MAKPRHHSNLWHWHCVQRRFVCVCVLQTTNCILGQEIRSPQLPSVLHHSSVTLITETNLKFERRKSFSLARKQFIADNRRTFFEVNRLIILRLQRHAAKSKPLSLHSVTHTRTHSNNPTLVHFLPKIFSRLSQQFISISILLLFSFPSSLKSSSAESKTERDTHREASSERVLRY
jgi:hypothetical protein